jgi:four helix bundle protein
MAKINTFRDLIVYQLSFQLAMEIFELTKTFPKEEKYSLTDQIRRSSRSVSANIAEAWAKKLYPKHFVSKLTDSLGEAYETEVWLDYSLACGYINQERYTHLTEKYTEVTKMLNGMILNPEKFIPF